MTQPLPLLRPAARKEKSKSVLTMDSSSDKADDDLDDERDANGAATTGRGAVEGNRHRAGKSAGKGTLGGLVPTAVTFNILISALSHAGQFKEAEALMITYVSAAPIRYT